MSVQCFGSIVTANNFSVGSDKLVCSDAGKWMIENRRSSTLEDVRDAACPADCESFRLMTKRCKLSILFDRVISRVESTVHVQCSLSTKA